MTLRIAIVGGGPRGLSVLERLCAGAARGPGLALEVLLYEPGTPGAGRVWDPAQPRELLMNTRAGEVTIFPDETVPVSLPARHGPTLLEWARAVASRDDAAWAAWPLLAEGRRDIAADLVDECARIAPTGFPSRALYGAYLADVLRALRDAPPEGVVIRHRARRVVDVVVDGPSRLVVDDTGRAERVDAAVLALGWLDAEHPRPAGDRWIGPDNPIDQDLSRIAAGERVLLTGLGMSMFDNLARLTEGRGGRFVVVPGAAGAPLRYVPSGREPLLVIGSASGRPYWPKPVLSAPPRAQRRDHLDAVLERAGLLDFDADIWPALVADAASEFYRVLRERRPTAFSAPAEEVDARVARLAAAGRDAHDRLAGLAETILRDPSDGLPAAELLGATPPPSAGAAWLLRRLGTTADAVERGEDGPLVRALTSLSGARAVLAAPLAEGRVSARSRADGYRRYGAAAPRLGGGPPVQRVRQLLALVDVGVAVLLGPGLRAAPEENGLGFSCADGGGARLHVDWVVESWMHRPSVARTADPLLRALRDRGVASAFAVRDDTGEFVSDALHVDPADGALVSARGARVDGLHAVGIPSDEQLGHSVVSPVPRSGSRFLAQTDAAARAVIEHAAAGAAERTCP
ncbi:FAD/NAD(P)-binding protein [Microbacterium betulae]|uniref:FAD/NAD(P)-binding protein n=1 Tax=Microbacterium betulae TaxID=2981139 RepID=A0AA97I584_9MICO|nr:FAD/NAD(P)-binding protein [Microbacterium sp. AB]WOF23446.1 FAD/NAD(P)-binding protein [Microbacterium sp. AB]